MRYGDDIGWYTGSGRVHVVGGHTFLITAAHNLTCCNLMEPPDEAYFLRGKNQEADQFSSYQVLDFECSPSYTGDINGGYDIAVALLKS